uniref:Uncharacterized protein n=1 Tax=Varanus komodoensis TaxID=61221 RepID=A0A8D2IZ26_VARKO
MDVRFYPAASGSALPGDPSNLDFAQCLGYYSYNKTMHCCRLRSLLPSFQFSVVPPPDLQHTFHNCYAKTLTKALVLRQ